ncbi:MAG: hypothetical protein M1828_003942 [Chrysothrix sp. TS-e1954]|nr:MAG: hypothetical protein M1828_003942 [Chrysothrix sp. TS-e1954]
MSLQRFFSQPLSVQWQTALVRLPRACPASVLKYTSPEGPHPFIVPLPSRDDKRQIPVYVFVSPRQDEPTQRLCLPVVLDFHGGGFFMGSPLEQAPFCAKLTRDLGAVVISVDYRMGPIDKFPTAYEDAEDVLSAVLDPSARGYQELRRVIAKEVRKSLKERKTKKGAAHSRDREIDLDTTRVGVSGFSSGGNLALNMVLSTPLLNRSDGGPDAWPSRFPKSHVKPIPVLAYYPSLDCQQLPSKRARPENLPEGSKWWSNVGDLLQPSYLPLDAASHPRASPGLANVRTMLHTQARVHLVLAELDTLTSQGVTWTTEMKAHGRGNDVTVDQYKGMKHGWTQFPESFLKDDERRARDDAWEKSIQFLKNCWKAEKQIER